MLFGIIPQASIHKFGRPPACHGDLPQKYRIMYIYTCKRSSLGLLSFGVLIKVTDGQSASVLWAVTS